MTILTKRRCCEDLVGGPCTPLPEKVSGSLESNFRQSHLQQQREEQPERRSERRKSEERRSGRQNTVFFNGHVRSTLGLEMLQRAGLCGARRVWKSKVVKIAGFGSTFGSCDADKAQQLHLLAYNNSTAPLKQRYS